MKITYAPEELTRLAKKIAGEKADEQTVTFTQKKNGEIRAFLAITQEALETAINDELRSHLPKLVSVDVTWSRKLGGKVSAEVAVNSDPSIPF